MPKPPITIKGVEYTSTPRNVQITFRELVAAVDAHLRAAAEIPADAYLNTRNQLVCDDSEWRHGSVGTEILDVNPSVEQVSILKFLTKLNSYMIKYE